MLVAVPPGQGECMYWEYFGFEENPFSISPDPRYLYMSKRHQEALAHLLYGIGEAGGFVLLSGEVGTGKTTICRSLIEQLPDTVDLAFVLNPRLNEIELLATICDEMGISYPREDPSLKVLVDHLNDHLLDAHARGRQPVLIIDEAQNLSPDVLEQIRLLTNLETTKRKLLQIVLIGQPELKELLKRQGLRQLDQRITARYHLAPLSLQDTGAYIRHRLQVGGTTNDIFTTAAIRAIFDLSGGVPRLINTLCDRCLLGAYAENKSNVDARMVRGAATEVLGLRTPRRGRAIVTGGLAVAIAVAAAVGIVILDPLDQKLMQYLPLPVDQDDSLAITATAVDDDDTRQAPAMTNTLDDPPSISSDSVIEPPPDLIPNTALTAIEEAQPSEIPPHRAIALAPPSEVPSELGGMYESEQAVSPSDTAETATETDPPTVAAADLLTRSAAALNGTPIENTSPPSPVASMPQDTPSAQLVWGGPGLAGESADEPAIEYLEEPVIVALPTPPPPPAPPSDPKTVSDLFTRAEPFGDIESAAHSLFRTWDYDYTTLKGVTPCHKARYAELRCLQSRATWHELRTANRPAVITLSNADDRRIYATVIALRDDEMDIVVDGFNLQTTVGGLSRFWTGDFLLLWRPPLPYAREIKLGRHGDDVAWLRAELAKFGFATDGSPDEKDFDTPLQDALRTFQRRQGLNVDGIAGPRTLIQINIATGAPNAPALH